MSVEHSPTKAAEESNTESTTAVEEKLVDKPHVEAMNNDDEESRRANIDATQVIRLPPFWKDNPVLWFAQAAACRSSFRNTPDNE